MKTISINKAAMRPYVRPYVVEFYLKAPQETRYQPTVLKLGCNFAVQPLSSTSRHRGKGTRTGPRGAAVEQPEPLSSNSRRQVEGGRDRASGQGMVTGPRGVAVKQQATSGSEASWGGADG
jgi:hypothetical protein